MVQWIGKKRVQDIGDSNEVKLEAGNWKIDGTAVDATAAEINAFASSGVSAAEAAVLGALTATAAELNLFAAASVHKQIITKTFEYDFAVLGGAAGAITLTDTAGAALTIPDNAGIVSVEVEAVTSATSGGLSTVKLGFTGNDDAFMPVTAYDNGEFTAESWTIQSEELPVKTTAAVSVLATIATADLTAGLFLVHVNYRAGVA